MAYNYLDSSIDKDNLILPNSDKINPCILKQNHSEVIKAINFLNSDERTFYIHGFLGTGKRQVINYICDFLNQDVIKLEYYCKEATVCDDILLSFINKIEQNSISKAVNINFKIATLAVKLQQYISSIKKPFLIILHSYDNIQNENVQLIYDFLKNIINSDNVKFILSTRAMKQDILDDINIDSKIFLKGFSKEIFTEFLKSLNVECTETTLNDFYKYTRGYYYYTAIAVKIFQAMKISLNEFLEKCALSGMSFDSYLGITYVNLIPSTIRNFFWFLRTVRHGLSLNALAVLELYDEFSLEYLKSNLMLFQADDTIYIQDYFQQNIDISIPQKVEIKLHKYIINIYEKQLKEPLKSRVITISRQALRAEIEYHNSCIQNINENKQSPNKLTDLNDNTSRTKPKEEPQKIPAGIEESIKQAKSLTENKKYTEAIEEYLKILDSKECDLRTVIEIRLELARIYKQIGEYSKSEHYYELVETYYKHNSEVINLSYLHYEQTELYFSMYKNERAIKTIKEVVYSVDTPQTLMVAACTLLGNIYSDTNNPDEAYSYYQKALASLDENTEDTDKAELYFKYALANDERGEENEAFEYYTKCTLLNCNSPYKALAFSNMGSCYLEKENYADAENCFSLAYKIEKANNNYDGIYYNTSNLSKIYLKQHNKKALEFLQEAKQSAEFLNEEYYMLESYIALGDYYYNDIKMHKKALDEYFKAIQIATKLQNSIDITKIESRINDMKLRMDIESFNEIADKYK